jgi:hypothetical protein
LAIFSVTSEEARLPSYLFIASGNCASTRLLPGGTRW